MFHRIMLATDGSEHAIRAAGVAGSLAGRYQAELVIIHVASSWISLSTIKKRVDEGRFPKEVISDVRNLQKVMQQARTTPGRQWDSFVPAPASAVNVLAKEVLDEAERIATGDGAQSIMTVSRAGHSAEEIVKYAQASAIDLVVMGTRGRSNMRGAVLGSVSQKVLWALACPCVIVK